MLSRLRISSHWPAKFSAIAEAFGSASIRVDLRVEHRRRAQPAPLGQRQQLLVRHRVPEEVAQPRGQLDVRDAVHLRRIVRVEIALDVEQEVRRDEHRLNRQRDALLHRLPVALRQVDELPQRRDFRAGDRPAVGAPRQRRQDAVDAARTGRRIADQDALAARLLTRRGERPDDGDRADPLVDRVLVDVLLRQRLDERIVDEPEAQRVIAFGNRDADALLGKRVEIDEAGRLGLDRHGVGQLPVHPEAERDRRAHPSPAGPAGRS